MGRDHEASTADPRGAIMEATYEAVCEHGYADLTIQAIADEFPKSKSLLYYHYETKEDLLSDFLEYLLDRFARTLEIDDDAPPDARLDAMFDHLVPDDPEPDPEVESLRLAVVEMRLQAPYSETYREAFRAVDDRLRALLADAIAEGIETGAFREVDPEAEADVLLTYVVGAIVRNVTTGDDTSALRARLDDYVERTLFRS